MTYTPTNWVDNVTQVTATQMNRIEQGIVDALALAGLRLDGTAAAYAELPASAADGQQWAVATTGRLYRRTNGAWPAEAAGVVLRGADGVPGRDGTNASLTAGTTVTGAPGTNAEVTISGSGPNQVLSLTIPAGAPGSGLKLDGQVATYSALPSNVADGQQWGVTADAQVYRRTNGAWPAQNAGQPTGGSVADGQVSTTKLADAAVTGVKIANGSVDTSKIADGGVATGDLADQAVTAAKVADGAIGTAKVQDGAVSTAKVGDGQITAAKIASGVIPDVSGKLDKNTTDGYRLYGTAAAGTQAVYAVDQSAAAGTVPFRDGVGALYVATPTADGHAATKAYVDSKAGAAAETQVFHNIGVAADATISSTGTAFTPITGGSTSKWEKGGGSASMTIGTSGAATANRKAFWTGASQAWYAVTDLGARPVRGRGVFSFAQNNGSTDGTFCLAVLNQDPNMPTPNTSTLKMGTHFRVTRAGWAYTIWENNAEVVLLQGTHTLALNTVYAISFQVVGNTVYFRIPSGEVKTVTDARITNNAGNWCFAESYCPGANSDLVPVYEWEFGTGTKWDRLSAPAV